MASSRHNRTRRRNTSKINVKSKKTCSYKKPNGFIRVPPFLQCVQSDITRKQLGHPKHIYEINDNAVFPFVVFDYGGGHATIYNNRFNEETNRGELNDKLMDVKYEQIFPGDNGMNDPYWRFKRGFERGNNIMFQMGKGKYIFVGKGIHSFSSINGDTIRNFHSPMGGNYDSFPYAVGDKYIYLLNEHKYAPIGEFEEKHDAIRQYYCYDTTECKKYKTVSLPMKILYKPLHGYYL